MQILNVILSVLIILPSLALGADSKTLRPCPNKTIEARDLPCMLTGTQYTLAARSTVAPTDTSCTRLQAQIEELKRVIKELESHINQDKSQ